ncbi:Murein DD-endopeptidase MepM and murein hydrolase activator NlpD, contain LysM domain [Cognatiyoonia sediminum]|uniref:Murein DD-endopeptidase MepM and murein hydrolase activator NlpD, contain LysM domain n=1 Tax=Cognatiyoonia sediminum TaxID=1508389 RepID=A0A1M5LGV4_9RHOB|nr:M23 family metallopeptidase [Cognatiyoonia sediminum]SHG64180.1 Murein DD-endopeptidase MepM and murein hydrolase activator NlpD, contain LysM domain [Cognatiyoonia sediminum]
MALNRLLWTGVAAVSLVACDTVPDFDLRDLGDGFDTSAAVANLPDRPTPDARGVISYPNYQVVVAQRDDTIRTIATRLNLDATTLASFNGIEPDVALRQGEIIALPSRVAEPAGGPIQTLDIASVATTALERVDSAQPTVTTLPSAPAAAPAPTQSSPEPIQHRVQPGETIFQIGRLYNVPVQNLTEWNGLGSDLTIREGQVLLVPRAGARPPAATSTNDVSEPGAGSETPVPPSATVPLPEDDTIPLVEPTPTPEAPDLGTATQEPATTARFIRPVEGSVIRAFAPGRNEGIDIGVAAGTAVKAADAGSVAAVTTDTNGVAIVVIKHADNLLTVYTNLEGLTVEKNDSVSRGQTIGTVKAGDPSFVHFEVRRGLEALDPAEFLP